MGLLEGADREAEGERFQAQTQKDTLDLRVLMQTLPAPGTLAQGCSHKLPETRRKGQEVERLGFKHHFPDATPSTPTPLLHSH